MKRTNEPYGGGNAPRVAGSETSTAAAEQIEPVKFSLRDRVHACLCAARDAGEIGLTDDEIEQRLDLKHQTASARRRELVLLSQVVDSGSRRKTRSGREATVWRVVEVNEQLSLTNGPSQVDVVRDKLRARLGKLETLEQLDEVWQLVSRVLEGAVVAVDAERIAHGRTRYEAGDWQVDVDAEHDDDVARVPCVSICGPQYEVVYCERSELRALAAILRRVESSK